MQARLAVFQRGFPGLLHEGDRAGDHELIQARGSRDQVAPRREPARKRQPVMHHAFEKD